VRIQWAVPCRGIDVSDAEPGIVNLRGAGIDLLLIPSLPHPVGVIVACRFAMPVHDAGSTVDLEAHLLGPGMTLLESIETQINIGEPGANHPEGWEMTAIAPLIMQFTAVAEGAHGLEIRLDDKLAANATTWFTLRVDPNAATAA
jgi:hypothetical protein